MPIALYQPDIPQNVGSLLRLCACLGAPLHVIGPCGFALDEKRIRRVAMDYADHADVRRHDSWEAFRQCLETLRPKPRLVLLTTQAATAHVDFTFRKDDILLCGRESAGVSEEVCQAADAALRIPIAPQARSLNVVQAAAIALGEMLRQTGGFKKGDIK